MAVLGWIILGVLLVAFLFIPPALIGHDYARELGVWLLIWVFACVVTALIVFAAGAVTGSFG